MSKTMKTNGIVDRFEGDYGVVEYSGGKHFDLPKEMLPKNIKEGDSIKIEISIDEDETTRRKQEIEALAKKLFRNE